MTPRSGPDRKAQIVSAAVDRLFAVGFEGFRLGDVAKGVGINNATLIHHYPSKVALIAAVVETFTKRFQAVADAIDTGGAPREKLARHMQSSVDLMRTSPQMFIVLNEIMMKASRDREIARLVSIPLGAWKHHIVSLILPPADQSDAAERREAEAVAIACMAQLLGMGLLLNSADQAGSRSGEIGDGSESRAIVALTTLVEDTP